MHIKLLSQKHKLIKTKKNMSVKLYKEIMETFCKNRCEFFPLVEYFQGLTKIPKLKNMRRMCSNIIFKQIDTNGNNSLDRDEFFVAMKKFRVTQERVYSDELFTKIDTNHNGELDSDEFFAALMVGLK